MGEGYSIDFPRGYDAGAGFTADGTRIACGLSAMRGLLDPAHSKRAQAEPRSAEQTDLRVPAPRMPNPAEIHHARKCSRAGKQLSIQGVRSGPAQTRLCRAPRGQERRDSRGASASV